MREPQEEIEDSCALLWLACQQPGGWWGRGAGAEAGAVAAFLKQMVATLA